jgi:hypothetical protein
MSSWFTTNNITTNKPTFFISPIYPIENIIDGSDDTYGQLTYPPATTTIDLYNATGEEFRSEKINLHIEYDWAAYGGFEPRVIVSIYDGTTRTTIFTKDLVNGDDDIDQEITFTKDGFTEVRIQISDPGAVAVGNELINIYGLNIYGSFLGDREKEIEDIKNANNIVDINTSSYKVKGYKEINGERVIPYANVAGGEEETDLKWTVGGIPLTISPKIIDNLFLDNNRSPSDYPNITTSYTPQIIRINNLSGIESDNQFEYYYIDGAYFSYLSKDSSYDIYMTAIDGDTFNDFTTRYVYGVPITVGLNGELYFQDSGYEVSDIDEYANASFGGGLIRCGRVGNNWYLLVYMPEF